MLPVQAGAALPAGSKSAEATIDPTTSGVNVHVAGGTVAVDTSLLATSAKQTDGTQRSNPSPSTPYSSAVLETSAVLKASSGTFRSLHVEVDASTPDGTYYILLMSGSATVPANGAVTLLRPPQTVVHVYGVPDYVDFFDADGILFTTGCTACISTTRFTKTISGAYCLFAGSVL